MNTTKKENTKKGISMIIVLWIMAILTVLTTATALMTQGDIASTINLIKRKGALQLAETGSDYFISMIPLVPTQTEMIDTMLIDTIRIALESGGDTLKVHRVYMSDDSTRAFVLAPVPMIYSNAFGRNPYPLSPGGGQGSYYVYEFTSGGLMGRTADVEVPQKVVDVAAGPWSPLGGQGQKGNTMY
jgi:hypothetical protein